MQHYYFNQNTDAQGNHQVHAVGCSFLPNIENQTYIGYEPDCHAAIRRAIANTNQTNFNGCYYCCKPCHKE